MSGKGKGIGNKTRKKSSSILRPKMRTTKKNRTQKVREIASNWLSEQTGEKIKINPKKITFIT